MEKSFSILRGIAVAFVLIAAAGLFAWRQGLFQPFGVFRPANSLMVIVPYQYGGTWVFDDPTTALNREPFVAGVTEMINLVKAEPKG